MVGFQIPYVVCERRKGDIDICYANTDKAKDEIGLVATKTIKDMCKDSWNYEQKSNRKKK